MLLITSDLAGLLAQILPAFIVLLVLEQRRFDAAHNVGHIPDSERVIIRARSSGRRQALLLSNILSVIICLVVVQLGDQGFRDLNAVASLSSSLFMSAFVLSIIIYASTIGILVFLTIAAYRIAFTDLMDGPDFEAALRARSS